MAQGFEVGKRYWDRRGEYTVLEVRGETVRYRYADGAEDSAPATLKLRIHGNVLAERSAVHPHPSSDYFRALGFMARRAELNAEVPPQARAGFEERYHAATGERPVPSRDGYFPVEIVTTYDKWGSELRIYIPETVGRLDLGPDIEVRSGASPGMLRVNNNALWWRLVGMGFRLGQGRHLSDSIRATVPAEHHADFEAGFGR